MCIRWKSITINECIYSNFKTVIKLYRITATNTCTLHRCRVQTCSSDYVEWIGLLQCTHILAPLWPSPPLDNIRVMVIVWRLRGNIIRTALCWIVWHNVHSHQHSYVSSSYRSNRLGLSHWDPYAVRRGGCLDLYYCNMVEWFWWDSSLILTTNWIPSVLWHCWFGHLAFKNRPWNGLLCVQRDVKPYTLTHALTYWHKCYRFHLNVWQLRLNI